MKFLLSAMVATALLAGAWLWTAGEKNKSGSPSPEMAPSGISPDAIPDATLAESKALARFRTLPNFNETNSPTFKTVQSLAGALPTSQLIPLLDEFAGSMHDSIDGWRRAALWAEIGKRDPARGKALLESRFPHQERPQDPNDPFSENAGSSEGIATFESRMKAFQRAAEEANLAAFAYLRGRIEVCDLSPQALEPVISDFAALADGISNESWSSRVDELLFRSLARHDPELAWQLLPGAKKESPLTQYRSFFTYPAFQGFFDGLDSRKEATDYAYRWLDYWKSDAVKAAYTVDGHEDEQWYYRSSGISFTIVDALDRLNPEAIDAWAEACPYYDEDDLKRRGERGASLPAESLLAFPEVHRAFVPKAVPKP